MPGPVIGSGPVGPVQVEQANEEAAFSSWLAGQTGLDPRVVYSWAQLETGGNAIDHNWLNLRPYPGDPYVGVTTGGFERFASVADAERATLTRLRMPFAAPILRSAGKPPATEIAAIASTGWDAGHYGGVGGPNLLGEFRSIYPSADPSGSAAKGNVTSGGTATGTGSVSGFLNEINPVRLIGGIWQWILDHLLRLGLLLAGGALILVGVVLLARSAAAAPAVT